MSIIYFRNNLHEASSPLMILIVFLAIWFDPLISTDSHCLQQRRFHQGQMESCQEYCFLCLSCILFVLVMPWFIWLVLVEITIISDHPAKVNTNLNHATNQASSPICHQITRCSKTQPQYEMTWYDASQYQFRRINLFQL